MRSSLLINLAAATLASLLVAGCQSQQTFNSPEEAASALAQAAGSGDKGKINQIFGPDAAELRSGDEDVDAQDIQAFRREISEAHALQKRTDDAYVVLVGNERWPFAVPIVKTDDGWRFDTEAGIIELENRRIGRNEIRAIEVCRTLIAAQEEYRSADRGDGSMHYADRLLSSPDKKDGLYWPSEGGVDPSPIGPALAEAAARRDDKGQRVPYYGYNFAPLTSQSAGAPGGKMDYYENGKLTRGWAVIAWPDEYDHTGVMSFLVSHNGVIYQADLGPDTETVATSIKEFDPSTHGWQPVTP